MSLKDKAAAASRALADFDEPVGSTSTPGTGAIPTAVPKARSGVGSITETIGMHHRVSDLEQKISAYEKTGVIVELDPTSVAQSQFRNRHELSFATQAFQDLRSDIANAGGNVQPILVRPAAGDASKYQVVYGRRRLRACLDLGIKVKAVVIALTDAEAFQVAERENRDRADLSPWEQGMMYKDGIDYGVFGSIRQMAAALNLNHSHLSKSIRLASLPQEILDAFVSPLDLQFRWAGPLCDAFEKSPQRMLEVARGLVERAPRLSSKDVFEALRLGDAPHRAAADEPREFLVNGEVVATLTKVRGGGASLLVKPGAMQPATERKFVALLERFFQGK